MHVVNKLSTFKIKKEHISKQKNVTCGQSLIFHGESLYN